MECGYVWFPRGRNVSRRCPNCGVVFTVVTEDRPARRSANWSVIAVVAFFTPFLFCCGCLALFSGVGKQATTEVRSGDPVVEPRPAAKAPTPKLPGIGEWVKSGDVRIVIDHAVVGSPVILTAKDGETKGPESLIVWFEVESTTQKPFAYRRPTENVTATDDRGRSLEYRTGRGVVIKDDVAFAKLTPEKPTVGDVMIFEPPAFDADSIDITIPAVSRDQDATFRFRVTAWEGKVYRPKADPPAETVAAVPEPPSGTAQPNPGVPGTAGGSMPAPVGGSKSVFVHGYYRKDGTYVRPHTRSPPRRR
jgi:hypothetical protein